MSCSLSAFLIEHLVIKVSQATIHLRSKTLSFLPSAFYFPAFSSTFAVLLG